MKKVKMILTNKFGPDERVYKEAKYLVEKGLDVEVLCWDRENEFIEKETDVYEGIKIKRFFPYSKYGSGKRQLLAFLKFINQCRKYLKRKKVHFLHCHDIDGMIVGFFVKKRESKIIFDMHEIYILQKKNKIARFFIRFLVNKLQDKAEYIIYVNDAQAHSVNTENKKKLIFLPNYPEKKIFMKAQKISSEKIRISYIGIVRFYEELKNLIAAVKDNSEIEVQIHGDGVAYLKLKEITQKYNNVVITGRFPINQLNNLYRQSDLIYSVYPMKNNQYKISYPIKFYQAIITKTPIIVSKGSTLETFIKQHDIGFAVDGENIDEIKDCIQRIIENREMLQEKTKNLEKIQFEYCWENIITNILEIYEPLKPNKIIM